MYFYAQIDENKICRGISRLSKKMDSPYLILIDTPDNSLLGKKYSGGTWEESTEFTPAPPTDAELIMQALTDTEQAILQTALNTEYMMTILELTI